MPRAHLPSASSRALLAASTGLAFGAVVDISPMGALFPPARGPQLVAEIAARKQPPPPPPPPPALAPALIALGASYLLGFLTGALLSSRRAKKKAALAASLRRNSGRDALQRARAVLDVSLVRAQASPSAGAEPPELLQARAAAAEAGLAAQTAQLRELQGALAIAGAEFEEALSEKDEALEEAELLRLILEEKEAQLKALEELASGAMKAAESGR